MELRIITIHELRFTKYSLYLMFYSKKSNARIQKIVRLLYKNGVAGAACLRGVCVGESEECDR